MLFDGIYEQRPVPTLIQVDSLKINVRDADINDDATFLTEQQALLVGRQSANGNNYYNFIVDHEGVMINAPLSQRTNLDDQYSLYVDGNMYVTGDIIAGGCNLDASNDGRGIIECLSDDYIEEGTLVEVIEIQDFDENRPIVRKVSVYRSTTVLGVCIHSSDEKLNNSLYKIQVQISGISFVQCLGPIKIGALLETTSQGIAIQHDDTTFELFTFGKALQALPNNGVAQSIRCMLFNGANTNGVKIGDNFWELGYKESKNIFYPGHVTIGNDFASRKNMHSLNIVQSADRTIEHAQINVENTRSAHMRMGIIGTNEMSPAVIATGANGLEFHANRDQSYFQKMYSSLVSGTSDTIIPSELPDYTHYNDLTDAPHLKIGADGNIGIHTSQNPPITFSLRTQPNGISLSRTEQMALHVQGSTFSSNMLIWDYDTDHPRNIDDLYVRKLGVTFNAKSVIPGPFANGGYYFKTHLGVGGNLSNLGWCPLYALTVHDNAKFAKNVYVDGTLHTKNLVSDGTEFVGDVRANHDIVVGGTLRLEGGIMVEVQKVNEEGLPYMTWENINFSPIGNTSNQFSNIGNGLVTSKRLGVGMPQNDQYARNNLQSQLVVNKINPSQTCNVWELEVKDLSSKGYTPVGWIGHPLRKNDTIRADASLFLATPCNTDIKYSGIEYDGVDTNIYLYPGRGSLLGVDMQSPPTMAVCGPQDGASSGKVGIGTRSPDNELTVNGSISFTDKLIYKDTSIDQEFKLGLWKSLSNNRYQGIQYINNDAAHVGINTLPNIDYGVVMGSNIKIQGSIYDAEDSKYGIWYDANDDVTVNRNHAARDNYSIIKPPKIFTWSQIGVGVNTPYGDVDVKNNDGSTTTLRLLAGDVDATKGTAIHMQGVSGNWRIQTNDTNKRLDIGFDTEELPIDTPLSNSTRRPLWMQSIGARPQTFIGCPLNILSTARSCNIDKTASLIVDGGLSVIGNVNITGNYVTRGTIVMNPDPSLSNIDTLNLGIDDVYIGGGHVLLNPSGNKTVVIGNPKSTGEFIDEANSSMLRVYHQAADVPIASFRTSAPEGLIEIVSKATNEILRFGVLNPSVAKYVKCPFAFMDENNDPYLAFSTQKNGSGSRYVGFNTFNPQAMLHVSSTGTGCNMMKLTTVVTDQISCNLCPQMELEVKSDGPNASTTSWTITGPDRTFDSKLSLLFKGTMDIDKKEAYTFTATGRIGIGSSEPKYVVDIPTYRDCLGGLRIGNTLSNVSPQLVIQAEQDFRIYTHGKRFTIDSFDHSIQVQRTVLNVNDLGNIGLCKQASSSYNVDIDGRLNVSNSIYLNGIPIFSIEEIPKAFLRATNIYLQPNNTSGGGLHINTSTSTESGNLIYIKSGVSPNMAVLDSIHDETQIHMRTVTSSGTTDTWRMGTSNQSLYWELWKNSGTNLYFDSTHVGYERVLQIDSTIENTYEATLSGHLNLNHPTAQIQIGQSKIITTLENDIKFQSSTFVFEANAADSNAQVGIGTHPLYPLHVEGSNTSTVYKVHQNGSGNIATFSSASTDKVIIDNQGTLRINNNSAEYALDVSGSGRIVENLFVFGNAYVQDNLVVDGNTFTRFDQVVDSDVRLKTDIEQIEGALNKVCKLSGYTYKYTHGDHNNKTVSERSTGLIAQQVLNVMPEAVGSNVRTGMYGVEYGSLMGLIVEAIKELKNEVDALKKSIHSTDIKNV